MRGKRRVVAGVSPAKESGAAPSGRCLFRATWSRESRRLRWEKAARQGRGCGCERIRIVRSEYFFAGCTISLGPSPLQALLLCVRACNSAFVQCGSCVCCVALAVFVVFDISSQPTTPLATACIPRRGSCSVEVYVSSAYNTPHPSCPRWTLRCRPAPSWTPPPLTGVPPLHIYSPP